MASTTKSSWNRTPPHVEAEVCERYARGECMDLIARMMSISPTAVYNSLKRSGVKTRPKGRFRFSCHDDAFDTITEESAYWIGFLMADGCVFVNNGRKFVGLALSVVDEQHVESFRAFMGISKDKKLSRYLNGAFNDSNPSSMVKLSFCSEQVYDALCRHGVTPRKTLTAKVAAHLEDNRDFWRGVIDGDGCLGSYPSGPRLEVAGSEALIRQYEAFLKARFPGCTATPRPRSQIWTFSVANHAAWGMIDILYRNCRIALARKTAVAADILAKPQPPSCKKYEHQTIEELEAIRNRCGSWREVAEHLGMPLGSLAALTRRLRSKIAPKP